MPSPRLPPARLVRILDSIRGALARLHRRSTLPEAAMLEIIVGGWLSQAVHAAVKLGIPEVIGDHPQRAEAIAHAISADADAVFRLLRALAPHGVFAQTDDGRFVHSALSKTLRRTAPGGSLAGFALYVGSAEHRAHWNALDRTVALGTSAVPLTRGMPFFSFVQRDSAFGSTFNEAMTSVSDLAKQALLDAYDFGRFTQLVDIGGGHGRLLGSILSRHACMRGVLLDLPEVAIGADDTLSALGVRRRCEVTCGSFFDAVPAGGDAYLLKHILHDWDDVQAQRILRNVRSAIAPKGTLLIVEGVVPSGPSPHLTKLLDLEMLLSLDGRERTEAQFRALLASAGFELRRIVETAAPISVLEAVPIEPVTLARETFERPLL